VSKRIFLPQDLACAKCKAVKELNMSSRCESCAGAYVLSNANAVDLKTFAGIAEHFQMPLLAELVSWAAKSK